ncbi:MAG: AraC family transcriptional regulator [Cytophagales bacterium]|nr:AraC family transcriptional regulator [Cytophagales bacterium]
MQLHTLYIKDMVCSRCVLVVEQVLQQLAIPYKKVELGEVHLEIELIPAQLDALKSALLNLGFGLMDNRKAQHIEKVKTLLIDLIQNKENNIGTNYSTYLSEKLNLEYSYLSNLFSSIENTTIEKYIIKLKIEKVKEWLVYHDLTLHEIAYRLNYSSIQALSSQFKKVTGLTPSYYKKVKKSKQLG